MKRAFAFAVILTLAAGCSSGSGVNLLPGGLGTNPNASRAGGGMLDSGGGRELGVQVTMRIPERHRRAHFDVHPATISPLTRSVGIAVNGGKASVFNATPSSPNCSVGVSGTTCTFVVKAPPGSDTFVVTTFSSTSGGGTVLDRGTAIVPIAAGKANAPHIHLGPVVSNLLDSGAGSLRFAIGSANPGDTIMFTFTTGTIKVASALTLNTNVAIAGPGFKASLRTRHGGRSGLSSDTTFSGITISGQGTQQIFVIGNGVKATISGLVLIDGFATISGQPGGAIYNGGSLTLLNDALQANDSQQSTAYIVRLHAPHQHRYERAPHRLHPHILVYHYGGAVYNHGFLTVTGSTFDSNAMQNVFNSQWSKGGAIYNDNYGTLVSSGNRYTNNSAYDGGAVYNNSTYGQASFTNDVFSGNSGCNSHTGCASVGCATLTAACTTSYPTGYGGAIFDNDGPGVTIVGGQFSNNVAGGTTASSTGDGGALNLESGSPSVTGATFTSNLAGGGLSNCSGGEGGAIYEDAGNTIQLTNDVFTGNKASGDSNSYGGAVFNDSNPDSGSGNTFTSNQAIAAGSVCKASALSAGGALYAYYGITMSASKFSSNVAKADYDTWGGAIYNESGPATLTSDAFTSNGAVATGLNTAPASYAYGGALYADTSLRVSGSTFSSNGAVAQTAGGVEAWGGAVYTNSTFTSNGNAYTSNNAQVPAGTGTVDAKGGAIYANSSNTLISNGDKFTSNSASAKNTVYGGAVYVDGTWGITNATFTSNKVTATGGEAYGGAVALNSSGTIATSTFTGNSSSSTGYSEAYDQGGGAIYDDGGSTFNGLKVSSNSVTGGSGGGIYNRSSTEVVNNSTISGNSTSATGTYAGGGGIYNYDGMSIANSTISGNSVAANGDYSGGGGVYMDDTLTLTGSTVSGNKVTGTGTLVGGGGVMDYYYELTAMNTTISNNSSSVDGGGILIEELSTYHSYLENVTLYQNTAATDGGNLYNDGSSSYGTLANTIVAGGSAASGKDVFVDGSGILLSMGYNIVQTAKAGTGTFTAGTGDKTVNPLLLGLANNGGPTFTNADTSTSPGKAYIPWTSASGGTCGTVTGIGLDQRTFTRGAGGKCDVGAYEYNGAPSAIKVLPQHVRSVPHKTHDKPHVHLRPIHERTMSS